MRCLAPLPLCAARQQLPAGAGALLVGPASRCRWGQGGPCDDGGTAPPELPAGAVEAMCEALGIDEEDAAAFTGALRYRWGFLGLLYAAGPPYPFAWVGEPNKPKPPKGRRRRQAMPAPASWGDVVIASSTRWACLRATTSATGPGASPDVWALLCLQHRRGGRCRRPFIKHPDSPDDWPVPLINLCGPVCQRWADP